MMIMTALTCTGGETIFENGQFRLDTEKERRLSGHLKFAAANCISPVKVFAFGSEISPTIPSQQTKVWKLERQTCSMPVV